MSRILAPRKIRTPLFAALAAAVTLSLVAPVAAFAEPIATIEQVSSFDPPISHTTGGSAGVAYNADSGVTLAAWAGTNADSALSAPIQMALISANGVSGPVTSYQPDNEFLGAAGDYEPISVDAGANGGFILTWNDSENDNVIYGILAGSNGAFIGEAFTISSGNTYMDIETVSAAWSPTEARYLISWKARVLSAFPAATGDQQLVGRFIDSAGMGIGSDFLLTNIPEQIDNSQDIAYGTSSWVVVGVDNSTQALRAVTVQNDGTVGAAVAIPAPTVASSGGPSVAFNVALNRFLLTAKANSGGIWGQLLAADGTLVGPSFVIDSAANSGKASVTSTEATGWLLAWHVNGGADVFGIQLDANAIAQGAAELVSSGQNDTGIESNFRPNLSFSRVTGQATVIWTRNISADNASNVVLRAWYVAEGIPLATTLPVVEAAVVSPEVAAPELAATGIDPLNLMSLSALSVLALLAGLLLVARRRQTA